MVKTHLSLQDCKESIEKKLDHLLTPPKSSYSYIFHAARYSLLSPGKRLRPLLAIATGDAFGASLEKTLIPGCAIEMIHTYSLIHDDLPCMDNDDLRRGIPTLHKVYPEGQALLAGDLLLTMAFETIASSPHLSSEQTAQMTALLAKRAGGLGMIGGQCLDLLQEAKPISWDTLQEIHLGKTAALLSACLEIGAIAAGVDKSTQDQLFVLGQKIGLAFQIVDDILDANEASSDQENSKSTSVSLLGKAQAQALAQDLLHSSEELCKQMHIADSLLASILPKLVYRSF